MKEKLQKLIALIKNLKTYLINSKNFPKKVKKLRMNAKILEWFNKILKLKLRLTLYHPVSKTFLKTNKQLMNKLMI